MMVDRKLRYTLSAAAWVCAFLCGLALMTSAMALANGGGPTTSGIVSGSPQS